MRELAHTKANGRPKVAYRSASDAKRAARTRMADGLDPIGVYRCPECSAWHLGHTPRRQPMKVRRDERRLADPEVAKRRLAHRQAEADAWAAGNPDLGGT